MIDTDPPIVERHTQRRHRRSRLRNTFDLGGTPGRDRTDLTQPVDHRLIELRQPTGDPDLVGVDEPAQLAQIERNQRDPTGLQGGEVERFETLHDRHN